MQPNANQNSSGPMDFSYPSTDGSAMSIPAPVVAPVSPAQPTPPTTNPLGDATQLSQPAVQMPTPQAQSTTAPTKNTTASAMPATSNEPDVAAPDTTPLKKDDDDGKNPLELLASKLNSFKESLIDDSEEKEEEKPSEQASATPVDSIGQPPMDNAQPAQQESQINIVPVNAPTEPMPMPEIDAMSAPTNMPPINDQSSVSPVTPTEISDEPSTEVSLETVDMSAVPMEALPDVEEPQEAKEELPEKVDEAKSESTSTSEPAITTEQATMPQPTPMPLPEPISESASMQGQKSETMVKSEPMPISAPTSLPTPEPTNEISLTPTKTTTSTGRYPFTIQQLLDLVVEREASDLHITSGYPAVIRVDGSLQPVSDVIVTPKQAEELIFPVLPEQKKELLEVNREVDLAYAHKQDARFRINAYFQKQSLAAAFRLIPNKIRNVDELHLPQIYHQLTKLRQGLVLVTGPTGSGKSTTLAAIIQEINQTRPDHILTIEDPIEYVFPRAKAMVDQRELHDDTHSWEIAMKSALRQDPNVVLVGEMRDYETIAAAITLAETGHLVFATLHTNSASQTIDRIIDVFPEHQQSQVRSQLSNVIEAVIAQRLIPLDKGGRMAVSEIMIATPAIRNLVREAKTHQIDNVIMTSADIGMISIEHSLVKMVREGLITMQKAQEYSVHPEEVIRLLKG